MKKKGHELEKEQEGRYNRWFEKRKGKRKWCCYITSKVIYIICVTYNIDGQHAITGSDIYACEAEISRVLFPCVHLCITFLQG